MNPPPTLPTYIFLLSDTSTRQLACDVAAALADADNAVFVDDFLSPIHDAFSAMWDLDVKRDLASPRDNNRLMLDYLEGEHTEGDAILDLEKWFCDRFGPTRLGQIAFRRAQAMRADFDYTFVFRDANVNYVKPFLGLDQRKLLFVDFTSGYQHVNVPQTATALPSTRRLQWLIVPDAEGIVKAIMEFDK